MLTPDYWVNTDGLPDNALTSRISATMATRSSPANAARETAVALFSIAPFLVGRIQSAKDHQALAERREVLERHIQAVLDPKRPNSDADVRSAQDELYRMRIEHRRIPSWLYNRYADLDRSTIDAAIKARVTGFRKGMSA